MHDQVHLTIVTSLSIIITFVLHCTMIDIPVRQTYLQVILIDFLRDLGLTIRCLYNQGINNITLIDILMCLHHRGRFYHPSLTDQEITPRKKCQSGTYYIDGIDKWKTSPALGLGDFFTYNILILLALPPSSSIIIKIYVTLGSIVSVQIGRLLTFLLRRLTKTMQISINI
ncbi:unnamed protein product [Rotaria sordida]|uniref:Uncharacterized protein n=1 Tax=Rotaria sordida TaxID=392033 RepID=A0A815D953_9BILA|nr:unnamed protein product [Rotaria sordida]CAF1293217.1 unnamed protein product [Rotaria sordida]